MTQPKFFGFYLLAGVGLAVLSCKSAEITPLSQRATGSGEAMAACIPVGGWAPEEVAFLDSVLAVALDNEALYTIAKVIKPMSTVASTYIAVDTMKVTGASAAEKLRLWHKAADGLDCGPISAALIPFRQVYDGKRYLELVVFHEPTLRAMVTKYGDFWSWKGISENSKPSTVATVVEYSPSYERFRGYGYLFGYPSHVVDFFVDAARTADETGAFVERDFFQIPAWSGDRGRFVYAVPKDYVATPADSSLYRQSVEVLESYRLTRTVFLRDDGSLRAIDWLRAHTNE